MKELGVRYGYSLDETKLKEGLILRGVVNSYVSNYAIIEIYGSRLTASIRREDYEFNDPNKELKELIPIKTELRFKIMKFDKNAKPIRIRVSCKKEDIEHRDEDGNLTGEILDIKPDLNSISLYESMQEICKEYETNEEGEKIVNPILIESLNKENEMKNQNDPSEIESETENANNNDDNEDEDKNNKMEIEKEKIQNGNEFELDQEDAEDKEQNNNEIEESKSEISEEGNLDDERFKLLLSNETK